jgi:hypothetical protein
MFNTLQTSILILMAPEMGPQVMRLDSQGLKGPVGTVMSICQRWSPQDDGEDFRTTLEM